MLAVWMDGKYTVIEGLACGHSWFHDCLPNGIKCVGSTWHAHDTLTLRTQASLYYLLNWPTMCLLISWLLIPLGHQQLWNWIYMQIGAFLKSLRLNLKPMSRNNNTWLTFFKHHSAHQRSIQVCIWSFSWTAFNSDSCTNKYVVLFLNAANLSHWIILSFLHLF